MTPSYNPSKEEQDARFRAYDRLERMRELKDKKFPHFANQYGQRSFMQYIDDSERVLNGYTLSRESQGKEDWQSNMLDNITRAKLRGIASSVGLKVPDIKCQSANAEGYRSTARSELFKNITKNTLSDGNPTMHNFLEVWHLLSHGGLLEYDGYKTGGGKVRKVKSFDSRTGAIEEETVYVEGKGKPFNVILNPQEFYWWDMFVRDIQDQPEIAWVQHYTKRELETEFGKFPNHKFVHDRKSLANLSSLQETLYYTKWSSRVDENDDYEVFRRYSKEDDSYEIWVNGVCLFRGPLIWGDEEKYYPFAKSIAEPFANSNFFWGMSLPGILEAYQDQKNTIINSLADILYRQWNTPLLVGLANKDLMDWESEFVSQDNRYYVPDVNQVKPSPVQGINQADLAFLQVIDRGIEGLSIDRSQQGLETTGDRTAREAIIADERARELKGMLYLFLEDLWLQKYRLRTRTVLTHYLKDKAARKDKKDQIITINDYVFGTGERGVLDIHVAKNKAALLPEAEIEAREMAAEQMGEVYKIVSMPVDWMDSWHFDYSIVPGSFHNQDRIRQEDEFESELQYVTTLYPEFYVANKDKYLEEKLSFRGKHLDEYNPPVQPPPMPVAPDGTPITPEQEKSPVDQGLAMLQ